MNYRKYIFDQIDDIVTYGNGYDYATVYEMPVWLRRYTFNRIKERLEKDKETTEQQLEKLKPHAKQPKFRPFKFNVK